MPILETRTSVCALQWRFLGKALIRISKRNILNSEAYSFKIGESDRLWDVISTDRGEWPHTGDGPGDRAGTRQHCQDTVTTAWHHSWHPHTSAAHTTIHPSLAGQEKLGASSPSHYKHDTDQEPSLINIISRLLKSSKMIVDENKNQTLSQLKV